MVHEEIRADIASGMSSSSYADDSRSSSKSIPSAAEQMSIALDNPKIIGRETVWWQLCWCHEHCHKQANAATRCSLGHAAQVAGALFTCKRKASRFIEWTDKGALPYILLTDWREVKQCVDSISLTCQQDRPVFTVVMTEEKKQYDRALRWVECLPHRPDPVYVCRTFDSPKIFVDGLLAQLQHLLANEDPFGAASRPQAALHPQVPWLSLKAVRTSPQSRKSMLLPYARLQRQEYGSPKAPEGKALLLALQATQLSLPVATCMMEIWGPCCSRGEMERALQEAMPDSYEE